MNAILHGGNPKLAGRMVGFLERLTRSAERKFRRVAHKCDPATRSLAARLFWHSRQMIRLARGQAEELDAAATEAVLEAALGPDVWSSIVSACGGSGGEAFWYVIESTRLARRLGLSMADLTGEQENAT